jgi:Flp pilus assembly protein CpaB
MWTWLALTAGCSGEADRVMVVVAARDLSVGVPIAEGDVYGLAMEPRFVPENAFVATADVIGRVPSARILANEPINARRLADAELQRLLEAMVPPGLEVVTVPLDAHAGRAPVPHEDLVDVVSATRTPDHGVGARVVASGLPVLRVDGDKVAVMADPEQVKAIARARFEGTASVVLSPPSER